MRWPFRRRARPTDPSRPPFEPSDAGSGDDSDDDIFVCSTCGRSDLPETGGWDPPICLECDAQLNLDAEQFEHWSG